MTPTEPPDQDKLIDFVNDPKTIAKAVEGSMDKRAAVLYPPEDLRAEIIEWLDACTCDVHQGKDDYAFMADKVLRLCEAAVLAALPEKYQDATHLDYAINDVIDQAKDNIHSVFGGTGK